MSRSNIIFCILVIIHSAIHFLLPKSWQIPAYFVATIVPLIILLIGALITQRPDFATWTLLIFTLALSYAISNAVIGAFANHAAKNSEISPILIGQAITALLYIVSQIWFKLTQGKSFSIRIAWIFLVLFCINVSLGVMHIFSQNLQTTSLVSTSSLFSIVLVFQVIAVASTSQWDTKNVIK